MGKFKERLGALLRGERVTSGAMTAIIIAIVIALNVVIYALGVTFYTATDTDDLTISGATDKLFSDERVEGKKVTVTFCQAYDDIENSSNGISQWVLTTADQFAERYPELIELRFVNIITKQVVSRNDSSNIEYIDLEKYQQKDAEGNLVPLLKSSVIFECGENFKVLTDTYTSAGYGDFFTLDSTGNAIAYNGEEVMASMISWVLEDEHKTAYFTTFHGEVADIGFRSMLICAGYNVETVNLREREIPDDAELVIISNPQNDFERAAAGSNVRTEIERLRSFMENGGNLYVAIDPYVGRLPVLESFISEYGISISSTEREGKFYRNIIRDTSNAITSDFYTLVANLPDTEFGGAISETVSKYNSASVIVSNCASLELSGRAEPLLLSSESSSTYAGGSEVSTAGSFCISATSSALDASGNEAGRIMVVPCIYLTATDALISGGYANRDFLYAVMDTVFSADNVPYGCNTVFYSNEVLENLTMGTARVYTALILAVPAVIAVLGAVVIIKRKNR